MEEQTCQDLLVPGGELARWNEDSLLLLNVIRVHAMVQGNDFLGGYLCEKSTALRALSAVACVSRQRTNKRQTSHHCCSSESSETWAPLQGPHECCTSCAGSPLFSAIRSNVSPFRTVYGLTFNSAVMTLRAWIRGWHGLADSCKEEGSKSDPATKIPSLRADM